MGRSKKGLLTIRVDGSFKKVLRGCAEESGVGMSEYVRGLVCGGWREELGEWKGLCRALVRAVRVGDPGVSEIVERMEEKLQDE